MSRPFEDAPMTGKPRFQPPALLAALLTGFLGLLSGCTSLGESIPAGIGGLPIDAPVRAADPPAYPAVHDMPPTRAMPVLDEYSKKKLEDDLVSARDRQEGRKQEGRKQEGRKQEGRKQEGRKQASRKPTAKNPLAPPAPPALPDTGAARNP